MKRLLALVFATMLAEQVWATYNYDFAAVCSSGQTLYYYIDRNDFNNNTVWVTYPQYVSYNSYPYYDYYYEFTKPVGELVIPETVTNEGITYTVTHIGSHAFYGCDELISVAIPNSVTSIDGSTFRECSSLTSIDIPNSVTSIGACAFWYCQNLVSIDIPSSVTSIGDCAFLRCYSLTSVNIPNNVTSIGERAFEDCDNIESVETSSNVDFSNAKLYFVKDGFRCKVLDKNTVAIVSNSYTGDVVLLETITAGNTFNVSSIGSYAFYGDGVTSVSIPTSVTSIDGSAFYNCSKLTSITIPNSVTSIGYNAFSMMKNIYYSGTAEGSPWGALTVNGTIDGDFIFADAEKTQLTAYIGNDARVYIPNTVTSIAENAFYNCIQETVYIPKSVTNISKRAFVDDRGNHLTIFCGAESKLETWQDDWYSWIINKIVWGVDIDKKIWSVNITSDNSEYGEISVAGAGFVEKDVNLYSGLPSMWVFDGVEATIEAIPTRWADYHFVKWSDNDTTNPRVFTATKDTSFTAIFEPHTVVIDTAVAVVSCAASGLTEGSHCSICGKVLVSQVYIPAPEHTWVRDTAVAATCITTGLTEGWHCSVCGEVWIAQRETPATGQHHWVTGDDAVAATCTETGLTASIYCSVCDTVKAQEIVPAKGHIAVNDTCYDATCTKSGLWGGQHCSVCGVVLKEPTEIPAIGHCVIYGARQEATCTESGFIGEDYCDYCGEVLKERTEIPALGHKFVKYVYNNDATIETDGTETAVCAHGCGATDTRVAEGTKLAITAVTESAANAVNIYATGKTIVVENATEEIRVYNAMGALVCRDAINRVRTETPINGTGVYIVKTGNVVKRVVVN